METEETTTGMSWGVIVGFVWSILLIIVPFVLWITNSFMPELMLGAFIGASVRFGTDLSLVMMADGSAENLGSFSSGQMPFVIGGILLQFGTLFGAAGWALMGGGLLPIGIVLAMLGSYMYGLLVGIADRFRSGGSGGNPEPSDSDDSEWRFDVDDV